MRQGIAWNGAGRGPVAVALAVLVALVCASAAQAGIAPEINDTGVLGGVGEVTNVRFAPNGEVFAIDKEGQIFDFPSLAEPSNEVLVADFSAKVMDYEDRGMLGLAIDPQYPVKPYIYVLYDLNAPPGKEAEAPVWPQKECLLPPGPGPEFLEGGDGCVIVGRLSRITVDLTTHKMLEEKPLITDWCQQYTSHSIGDLQFGPEGELYASGGSGGAFNVADWGQYGGTEPNKEHPIVPANPCGDPNETSGAGPGVPGVTKEELPTAEGGVLRSQSFRRPANQPASLDGTIARIDPETGEPVAGNPNIGASDVNRKRIVEYGLRQPFRFLFRPGTSEIWEGDVGENKWEEINRDSEPLVTPSKNFGWPCFEGGEKQESHIPYEYGVEYMSDNLCKGLYKGGGAEEETEVAPYYAYNHGAQLKTGEECPYRSGVEASETGSSISGLAFTHGGPWPEAWDGALLFGDVTRDCIWAMLPETPGGLPKPGESSIKTVESLSAGKGVVCEKEPVTEGCPVDLELGPEGDIYYADINSGTVRRLNYTGYPVAIVGTNASEIHAGNPIALVGDRSTTKDACSTTYQWEFGDGATSGSAYSSHIYASPGTYTATLTVTDHASGLHDASSVKVTVLAPGVEATRQQPPAEPAPNCPGPPAKKEESVVTAPPSPPSVIKIEPPTLTKVSLVPTSFRPAHSAHLRKATGKGRSAVGATLRYTLSQKASLKLAFAARVHGKYQSVTKLSVCRGHGRKRKCKRPSTNSIVVSVGAGAGSLVLSGWVGGMPLEAGSYSVTLQATGDSLTVSKPVAKLFTIL